MGWKKAMAKREWPTCEVNKQHSQLKVIQPIMLGTNLVTTRVTVGCR